MGVDRWLVLGASWGSTLGLAYAQRHPERVSALVLFSVVTTTRREVEWITRDMGRVIPAAWARFRDGVPAADRDGDLASAYARLLHDPDPDVRERAARDWCTWEDTHVATVPGHRPDPRHTDPVFRMTSARLVTHYWRHAGFLPDRDLLRGAADLAGVPGVLLHGQLDISSPPDIPWQLAQVWPDARLELLPAAGYGGGQGGMGERVRAAVADHT